MTSVALVSPAHGRFAVTALVLAQRRRLIRELAGWRIDAISIIVADDENLDIGREYGCLTVEAPNLPLGQKCNLGLRVAASQADHIVWVGSDDWIHPDVFEPLRRPRRSLRVIVGSKLALVDLPHGRLQRISTPSKYGAIPWLIDRRLLRGPRKEWVQPDLNRGLDGALIRGIRLTRTPFRIETHDPNDFRCVDFKTHENITPYKGLAKNLASEPEQSPWLALKGWYPADLIDLAEATAVRAQGARTVKLTHPETGESARVSNAGAALLRRRGWCD